MPILGPSEAMKRVLEQVDRAAAGQMHVLITGEPGTGRETLAREIHRRGSSSGVTFAKLDCALLLPHELERELFGNASPSMECIAGQRRWIECVWRDSAVYNAIDGTIFLEQLTQIPARVQARLVRVVRGGEVVILPEREPVRIRLRVIGSVGHDYDQTVKEGGVRNDLHELMSNVRIDLPPLRRRREDIPALADYFVEEHCRRLQLPAKTLSEHARLLLAALPWYGNGAELRGLLHDLVHRVHTKVIQLQDVLNAVEIDGNVRPSVFGGTLREARAAFEHDYISAVLVQHHGRIPEAAKSLGIQRTNLYRKLKRLRLTPMRARQ